MLSNFRFLICYKIHLLIEGVFYFVKKNNIIVINFRNLARSLTEQVAAKEQIQLEVLGSYKTSNLELDKNKLKPNLEKIGATVTGSEFPLTVTLNENVFTIKDDGTVENGIVEVKTAKFINRLIDKTHGFEPFSQIIKIELAISSYAEQYKISTNLVSTDDSDFPIYMWHDNNVLY